MNSKKILMIASAVLILVVGVGAIGLGPGGFDLDQVRKAKADFQPVSIAEAVGYFNINSGECVANPIGVMGYRYVDFDIVHLELVPLEPINMVFVPDGEGGLRLSAVEFAVLIEPWDAFHESPPEDLRQSLSFNPVLGLYVLHVWLYEENPSGRFAEWNPSISCGV